jgi:hypothetical protein
MAAMLPRVGDRIAGLQSWSSLIRVRYALAAKPARRHHSVRLQVECSTQAIAAALRREMVTVPPAKGYPSPQLPVLGLRGINPTKVSIVIGCIN